MSAIEELEILVEAMAAAEPQLAVEDDDEDTAGDVIAWKISYSTFRN